MFPDQPARRGPVGARAHDGLLADAERHPQVQHPRAAQERLRGVQVVSEILNILSDNILVIVYQIGLQSYFSKILKCVRFCVFYC